MAACPHNRWSTVQDDLPMVSGWQVCLACGARRTIEGDHVGPWLAPADDAAVPLDERPS